MPYGARQFLADIRPDRILNTYHWGAFLTWELWPDSKVFVDGRLDPFMDAALPAYLQVTGLEPGWQATLARIDPDAILLQTSAPLVGALAAGQGAWVVAHRDPTATVLLPAGGER